MAKKGKIKTSAQSDDVIQDAKLISRMANVPDTKQNKYLQPKTKEEIGYVLQKIEILNNPFDIERAFVLAP